MQTSKVSKAAGYVAALLSFAFTLSMTQPALAGGVRGHRGNTVKSQKPQAKRRGIRRLYGSRLRNSNRALGLNIARHKSAVQTTEGRLGKSQSNLTKAKASISEQQKRAKHNLEAIGFYERLVARSNVAVSRAKRSIFRLRLAKIVTGIGLAAMLINHRLKGSEGDPTTLAIPGTTLVGVVVAFEIVTHFVDARLKRLPSEIELIERLLLDSKKTLLPDAFND